MFTYEIVHDDAGLNPRTEYDNLGTIAYVSYRYRLGDERVSGEEIEEILQDENLVAMKVYAYIHSGVSLSLGPFGCPWDSGMSGVIYASKETIRKEYGDLSPEVLERVRRVFEAEIEEFSAYLNGESYGWVVRDDNGNEVDAAWGYLGDSGRSQAIEDAKSNMAYLELKAS